MRALRETLAATAMLLAALAVAVPALAQDDDEEELLGIEEIVVTAERRSQSLQDVAQVINAFSLEDLTKQNIQDMYDLQNEVPSLVTTGGLPAITLRGIGQDSEVLGPGIDPGFQLHINDIYVTQITTALLDFFDLERVEVLPGPQGTLYGRNSTGGSINFHHARPDLENHLVKGEVEVANDDKVRVSGVFNVPLIENELGFRFAYLQEWPAKPVNVSGAGGHDQRLQNNTIGAGTSLRALIRWSPNETFTTDFIAGWSRDTNPGGRSQFPDQYPIGDPGGNFISRGFYDYSSATPNPESPNLHSMDVNQDQRYETLWLQSISSVELPGDLTLKFNANYQYFNYFLNTDTDGSDARNVELELTAKSMTWSGEATVASNWDGPLNFLFGTNYQQVNDQTRVPVENFRDAADLANFAVFDAFDLFSANNSQTQRICGGPCLFQPALPGYHDQFNVHGDTETKALGIFANANYDITEELTLTAGVRYSYTHRDFNAGKSKFDLFLETFDTFTDSAICDAAGIPGTTAQTCFQIINLFFLTPQQAALAPGTPALTPGNTLFLTPVVGDIDPTAPSLGTIPFPHEKSWNSITGMLRLEWRPMDGQLFYATVSTGERHGGFQFVGPSFDSEEVLAYEIGAKNTFLDGRMFLNTSLYYYDFENRFIQQTENNIPTILNAPEAEIYGIDLQLMWLITEAFQVTANIGWIHAEFSEDFITQDNTLSPENPDSYCPFKPAGDQYGFGPTCDGGIPQNIKGNRLPRAPEWTVSLGAQYVLEMSSGALTTRVDFSWRDSFDFRWFENPFDEGQSYHRTDLRMRYDPHQSFWWAEVYVQNLEDDDDVRTQLEGSTTGRRFWFAPGRTFGVRFGYEFENASLPWVN